MVTNLDQAIAAAMQEISYLEHHLATPTLLVSAETPFLDWQARSQPAFNSLCDRLRERFRVTLHLSGSGNVTARGRICSAFDISALAPDHGARQENGHCK